MAMSMSKEQVDQANTLIFGTSPILSRFDECMQLLKNVGFAQTMVLHVSMLCCHPRNRAKLGLNAYEAHRLGKRIANIGFRLSELTNCTCIEVDPTDAEYAGQLAFNRKLVAAAGGLLAEVLGTEKYLTLGGGHLTAFLKAVLECCKTSEPTLADADGFLDKHKLLKDATLRSLLADGFEWTVVNWRVRAMLPGFEDFAQRALNATNSVQSECSELEIMSSISEFAEGQLKMTDGKECDWDAAVDAACAGSPRCAGYAKVLAEFTRLYGGGPGAPVVHDLNAFFTKYTCTLILGEEFMSAVVEMKMSDVKPCPRIRSSLVAANLVSTKSKDGVSSLITKADVSRLASKTMLPIVLGLEQDFETTENLCRMLVQAKSATLEKARDCSLLFRIRSLTHLVGKSKNTILNAVYTDQKAILALFHKDLGTTGDAQPDSNQVGEMPDAKPMVELEKVSDPAFIALQKGFTVGQFVFEKSMGSGQLYKITAIGPTVKVAKYSVIDSAHQTGECSLERFLKEWSAFKGDVQEKIASKVVKDTKIEDSEVIAIDTARAGLFSAMLDYDSSKGSDHTTLMAFTTCPMAVYATKAVATGKLVFVPVCSLQNIMVGGFGLDTGNIVMQKGKKTSVTITTPALFEPVGKAIKCIHPFWWVQCSRKASQKSESNMVLKKIEHKGFTFNVLTNSKPLESSDQLKMLLEPKTVKHGIELAAEPLKKAARKRS